MAGRALPKTRAGNYRPLSKSEAWMYDKVEAAAMRKLAEDRTKIVRRFAARLAERRRITRDDALLLLAKYASKG